MPRTSKILRSKIAIFSQFLSIFERNKIGKTNDEFVTPPSFLSSRYRTDELRERRVIVRGFYWSLVMVRNQLPAQEETSRAPTSREATFEIQRYRLIEAQAIFKNSRLDRLDKAARRSPFVSRGKRRASSKSVGSRNDPDIREKGMEKERLKKEKKNRKEKCQSPEPASLFIDAMNFIDLVEEGELRWLAITFANKRVGGVTSLPRPAINYPRRDR